jgi:hypothetical protein
MRNNAIFKLRHLKNYDVIEGPCTAMVKVANDVKPEYLIEDGTKSRYLVNLRVGEKASIEEAMEVLGDRSMCAFSEVSKYFLTGVIWEQSIEDLLLLPKKGEYVIASFDYDDNEILRCVSITTIPRKKLEKFDLDAYNYGKKQLAHILKNVL